MYWWLASYNVKAGNKYTVRMRRRRLSAMNTVAVAARDGAKGRRFSVRFGARDSPARRRRSMHGE